MSAPAAAGEAAEWVAADWGTSRLRVWGMRGDEPLWREESDRGMGTLAPDEFEGALRDLLRGREAPVVACGMVGARQGWVEAPYAAVPCAPLGAPIQAPIREPGALDVRILPGLSQAAPPDVMRGEETQIAGLLAEEPGFDGVAVLPGTHTKWARLSAGEVVGFRTAMTGELFALLAERSVLRHSVAADGHDPEAFAEGLSDALARPESLAVALFGLRAASLLQGTPPAASRARLSGLLVGAELAALKPYWLGQSVAVIADGVLSRAYGEALAAQGLLVRHWGAEALTLAGLAAAHRRLEAS